MQEDTVKKLVRMKTLIMIAMTLLGLAFFGFILYEVFNFIWAIIGAIVVLAIRFGFYIYQDNNGWQQKLLLGLAILGVAGPVLYFIYKVLFVDSSSVWMALFLTCSFLMPVAILYYISRLITRMIAKDSAQ